MTGRFWREKGERRIETFSPSASIVSGRPSMSHQTRVWCMLLKEPVAHLAWLGREPGQERIATSPVFVQSQGAPYSNISEM